MSLAWLRAEQSRAEQSRAEQLLHCMQDGCYVLGLNWGQVRSSPREALQVSIQTPPSANSYYSLDLVAMKSQRFQSLVVLFVTAVAIVTLYNLTMTKKMGLVFQRLGSSMTHSSLAEISCHDPREDIEFRDIYEFDGRAALLKHGHSSLYFVRCKDPYKPTGDFRRGEITCWAGRWIWLTSHLKCTK